MQLLLVAAPKDRQLQVVQLFLAPAPKDRQQQVVLVRALPTTPAMGGAPCGQKPAASAALFCGWVSQRREVHVVAQLAL